MSAWRVAVVGGGPAGCAAAYALGRKSVDVIVLERGKPGKDKACGDCLVPSALELVAHFGISQRRIQELGGYCSGRVDLYANGLLVQRFEYGDNVSWVVPRMALDQELRNITAEYASFQYQTCVTDLLLGA